MKLNEVLCAHEVFKALNNRTLTLMVQFSILISQKRPQLSLLSISSAAVFCMRSTFLCVTVLNTRGHQHSHF